MKRYKVVLRKLIRREDDRERRRFGMWRKTGVESHIIQAPNREEAIKMAHELFDQKNRELPARKRVELCAIYELRPGIIPIAVRF